MNLEAVDGACVVLKRSQEWLLFLSPLKRLWKKAAILFQMTFLELYLSLYPNISGERLILDKQ